MNINGLKKWGALLIVAILPAFGLVAVGFFVGLTYAVLGMLGGILISFVIAYFMLKHPFTPLVEGKGLMVLDINSTGVIKGHVCNLKKPFIIGNLEGKPLKEYFNREGVVNMSIPQKDNANEYYFIANDKDEPNIVHINFTTNSFNKARFQMYQYPVVLYNSVTQSLLTKDVLSTTEKTMFAEHLLLNTNRMLADLEPLIRDFARYIVELTKKQQGIWQKYGTFIIIIVIGFVLLILGVILWPMISQFLGIGAKAVSEGGNIAGDIVTPK